MSDTEGAAGRIVEVVLTLLEGRKGFDWWWDDLDSDIRDEIRRALQRKVRGVLADATQQSGPWIISSPAPVGAPIEVTVGAGGSCTLRHRLDLDSRGGTPITERRETT